MVKFRLPGESFQEQNMVRQTQIRTSHPDSGFSYQRPKLTRNLAPSLRSCKTSVPRSVHIFRQILDRFTRDLAPLNTNDSSSSGFGPITPCSTFDPRPTHVIHHILEDPWILPNTRHRTPNLLTKIQRPFFFAILRFQPSILPTKCS